MCQLGILPFHLFSVHRMEESTTRGVPGSMTSDWTYGIEFRRTWFYKLLSSLQSRAG